jgi:Raf kinase inhibitor-like YbhB/YbcL family protein
VPPRHRLRRSAFAASVLLAAAGAGASSGEPAMAFTLRSTAFADGGEIPARHTCEGEDVSPALAWTEPPAGTRSLALVVDDPDAPDPAAPKTTWVHLVLYDLPAAARALPEALDPAALPAGARAGTNDWRRTGWGGPCPPVGRHRYFFKLFALDAALGERGPLTKRELERAMEGHVLGRAELVGTYQKRKGR